MDKILTYPARPINGGPHEKARTKHGEWACEPKVNGWRALVHVASGEMWNRHGEKLSIASEFKPALSQLRATFDAQSFEWADCEALERRHDLGRGTLVVLDVVPKTRAPRNEQRRTMLESLLSTDAVFSGGTSLPVPCGEVLLTPTMRVDSHADSGG